MDELIPLSTRNHMILLGGRPSSGKSYLCKAIIAHYKTVVDNVVILTGSIQNNFYQGFINKYVYEASEKRIDTILSITKHFKDRNVDKRFLLILDDIQDLSFQSKAMKRLISFHRQHNIDVIFCLQSLNGIGSMIRNNCNLAFIFHQNEEAIMKQLWKSFNVSGVTEKEFIQILNEATSEKYQTLFINKDEVNDPFRYVKVDDIGEFSVEN
jgi:adenylate kinase family enzyme